MTVQTDLASRNAGVHRLAYVRIDGLNYNIFSRVDFPGAPEYVPGVRRHPIDVDAVAVWRHSETSSSDNAVDSSGNGNNLTQYYSPTVVPVGKFGDGGRDTNSVFRCFRHLTTPSTPYQLANFTISAWFKYQSGTYIWCMDASGGVGNKIVAFTVGASGEVIAQIRTVTTGWTAATKATSATGLVTAGNTYLLTATYDGATLRIYINGAQVASTAINEAIDYTGINNPGITPMNTGLYADPPSTTTNLRGEAYDAAIYSSAKSAAWVASVGGSGGWSRPGLPGLHLPSVERHEELDLTTMTSQWSAITFELADIEDEIADDGTRLWGKIFAPGRWDNAGLRTVVRRKTSTDQTIPSDTATYDTAAGTLYVKKNDDFDSMDSSGVAYIGAEAFSYTNVGTDTQSGYTTNETLGTFTGVQKGLYPAIDTPAGVGSVNFGRTYQYPRYDDDMEGSTIGAQVVSNVPMTVIGRRIALYFTTYNAVTAAWNAEADSILQWVGTIESVGYDPKTGRWRLAAEAIGSHLERVRVGGDGPTAEIRRINLNGPRGLTFTLLHTGGNGNYITVDITPGYYSPMELATFIANALNTYPGDWQNAWGGNVGSQFQFRFNFTPRATELKILNTVAAAGDIDRWLIIPGGLSGSLTAGDFGMADDDPCHALAALGFDTWEAITIQGDANGETVYTAPRPPYHAYHPILPDYNGGKAFVTEETRTLWTDQGDYSGSNLAYAWAKKAYPDGPGTDPRPAVIAYTTKTPLTVQGGSGTYSDFAIAGTELTLAPQDRWRHPAHWASSGSIASRGFIGQPGYDLKAQGAVVQNVVIPEYRDVNGLPTIGPFTVLMKVLTSTGTPGYNGIYDVYPVGQGVGLPNILVDGASFLAADAYCLRTFPALTIRKFNPLAEPTEYSELFRREGSLFGVALVWRRGKLTAKPLFSVEYQDAVATLDDSTTADPNDFATVMSSTERLLNIRRLDYDYNWATEKYESKIIVRDEQSISALDGFEAHRKLEHPGVQAETEHLAIVDEMLVAMEREARLLRAPFWTLKMTLSPHLMYDVWVGDLVNCAPSTGVPDPAGTGLMSCNVPAMVLDVSWPYETMVGTCTLLLFGHFNSTRCLPWAPAALVDITATGAGPGGGNYDYGFDSSAATKGYLKLANLAYGSSGDSDDGARFQAGDRVLVQARGPADRTSLVAAEGPWVCVVDAAYETDGAGVLTIDDKTDITAWDTTGKTEYFVTFANYDVVTASQKTRGTWHADSNTELINGADKAHRWS